MSKNRCIHCVCLKRETYKLVHNKEKKNQHWTRNRPHDQGDHGHDDFIEDVEEVTHHFSTFPHPAHANPKSNEESNNAWRRNTVNRTPKLFTP